MQELDSAIDEDISIRQGYKRLLDESVNLRAAGFPERARQFRVIGRKGLARMDEPQTEPWPVVVGAVVVLVVYSTFSRLFP